MTPCTHEGIGLPGCLACDPREQHEGGPRPDTMEGLRRTLEDVEEFAGGAMLAFEFAWEKATEGLECAYRVCLSNPALARQYEHSVFYLVCILRFHPSYQGD